MCNDTAEPFDRARVRCVLPERNVSSRVLALFCYHRSPLHSMGLAIAASCDEDDLVRLGGRVGATLFPRSQEEQLPQPPASNHTNKRRSRLRAASRVAWLRSKMTSPTRTLAKPRLRPVDQADDARADWLIEARERHSA
jgi:hypothetical protein